MRIASAMDHLGDGTGMWDEDDGFFYDLLRLPDGRSQRLKVRSTVGRFRRARPPRSRRNRARSSRLSRKVSRVHGGSPGVARVDARSESAWRRRSAPHVDHEPGEASPRADDNARRERVSEPVRPGSLPLSRGSSICHFGGRSGNRVNYVPAESDTGMFGGNSNWRGPVWMPVNVLVIRALAALLRYYGDTFTIECPTVRRRDESFAGRRGLTSRLNGHLPTDADVRSTVTGKPGNSRRIPYWQDIVLSRVFRRGQWSGSGCELSDRWTERDCQA